MTDQASPRLYLITPPVISLSQFPETLNGLLERFDIACVRLALAGRDEETIARAGDCLRSVTEAHDVALVIEDHYLLAQKLGLDGVHLSDGARHVRKAREELGEDAVVGAYCANSRHDGMSAGEAGADYVSFGPVSAGALGDGSEAAPDLFAWWSEMIEVPVVAEGGMGRGEVETLSQTTDFLAFGDEIWNAEDPGETLSALLRGLG